MKLMVLKKFDTISPCIRILRMIEGRNRSNIMVLFSSECIKILKASLQPSFVSILKMYKRDSKIFAKESAYW